MKLLVAAQKLDLNDDNLGFFHAWVEKLAQKCEQVFVICNSAGEYNLPQNVKVFSLGREIGNSKLKRYFLFYKFFLNNIKKSDRIFFHMCPEYVLAGGLISKLFEKKNILWYTHKNVSWKLRLAEKLVDKIFTASKESCRIDSKKVEVIGHGININKFSISPLADNFQFSKKIEDGKFRIISAGRIAKVKNYDLLIEVAEILKKRNFDFLITIAGAPILEKDRIYFDDLKKKIEEKNLTDFVNFIGPVPYKNIFEFYRQGDLFVNFSDTGSIDKAVLEAMASGCLVLTFNEAFKSILQEKYFTVKNSQDIADKILYLAQNFEADGSLREYVLRNHNLENLADKLIAKL